METIFYVVRVHDIGEILDYEFSDLEKAQHFMKGEKLECSLWKCDRRNGTRLRIDTHPAVN